MSETSGTRGVRLKLYRTLPGSSKTSAQAQGNGFPPRSYIQPGTHIVRR